MTDTLPAGRVLDALGIPYRLFVHSQPPDSLEQAATQRGQLPGQVVRSIVFRVTEGQFVMVLVAGPAQVSWPKLRTALGVSRISLASEAEVLEATGYVRGAVGPLGLPQPLRILADVGVFSPAEISLGSGLRGTAILLKSADLKRTLGEIEVLPLT
jgi:prolyl-tRNA editing enzyme YbaK/EbsC (Cys-tRNA(Pro) deacylase)